MVIFQPRGKFTGFPGHCQTFVISCT